MMEPELALVPSEVLDQFAPEGPMTAFELEVAVKRFQKALIERALGAELGHHLGYPAARATGGHHQPAQRDDRKNRADG